MKYEDEAIKYKNRRDVGVADFSMNEVELCTLQLNIDRAGDRNSLLVEHVLFAHPIII